MDHAVRADDVGRDDLRLVDVNGTVFSTFKPNQKTKILNDVSIGSTVIDVDSTIGFPQSGRLDTTDIDNADYIVTFSTKNDNQFFNVPAVTSKISKGTDITFFDLAYAYTDATQREKIQVKISTALKDITFEDKNLGLKKGDTIRVKSIGIEKNIEKTRNWNLNFKASWKVLGFIIAPRLGCNNKIRRSNYFVYQYI